MEFLILAVRPVEGTVDSKFMGTFRVALSVGDLQGRRFLEVEPLVDKGATHTLLPRDVLTSLGIEVMEWVSFELADDRVVDYEVGEARLRLDGRERATLVVFGPEGAAPLLGPLFSRLHEGWELGH